MSFPIITKEPFHTQDGNCYKLYEDGKWYKIERYLASVPNQYGCKTYEEQFIKITSQLGEKLHPLRKSHSKPFTMKDGRLSSIVDLDAYSVTSPAQN